MVAGVIVAAPPGDWIGSIPHVTAERRLLLSRRMIDCKYLAVDPAARGHQTGAALTAHAQHQFTARGFRLMTATVTKDNTQLLPYYRTMGWRTLPPSAPLVILDPAGPTTMWRPSENQVTQMWMPLRSSVTAIPLPARGGIHPVITGVLDP